MSKRGWKNWTGHQSCDAEVLKPANVTDLRRHVEAAARRGHRVRAAGGGYSWTALVPTDGTVIDIRQLRGVTIDPDPDFPTATVECGVTIGELDARVREKGFTLVQPTMFPKPTVGGVVATGSHGTGCNSGNFCDQLLEIELIGADGNPRTVRVGDDEFPAAQVSLGALGIVSSVKLKLCPQFQVYVDQRLIPTHYVLEEMEDLRASYEFLETLWFPGQDKMWLYMMNRTRSRADQPSRFAPLARWLQAVKEKAGLAALAGVVKCAPRLTPRMNALASRLADEVEESVQDASEAFHFIQSYPWNWDLCYAVPAEEAGGAWRVLSELIDEYARAKLYPANLAAHCRFVGRSEAWLAPNHRMDSCFIEVTALHGTPAWQGFFAEVEERWAAISNARPHWAKLHGGGPMHGTDNLLYGKWRDVASLYPEMEKFLMVRDAWDPQRVFLNPYLEDRVFGLGAAGGGGPPRSGQPSLRPQDSPEPTPEPRPDR